MTLHQTPLCEPVPIQDTFVTDLAGVDYLGGGNFRLIFVSEARSIYTGKDEAVIVCRMVAGSEAIRRVIFMCARAIGMRIIAELSGAKVH